MKKFKKPLIFLLCTVFVFSLSACMGQNNSSENESSYNIIVSEQSSSAVSDEVSNESINEDITASEIIDALVSIDENSEPGILPNINTENPEFKKKFANNDLDLAYEEEIEVSSSVTEMISVNGKYASYWDEEITHAYECLLKVLPEDKANELKTEHEEWLEKKDDEIKQISADAIANGGTMAKLNSASSIMLYYRTRAAELYSLLFTYDADFSFKFVAVG